MMSTLIKSPEYQKLSLDTKISYKGVKERIEKKIYGLAGLKIADAVPKIKDIFVDEFEKSRLL